MGRRPACSESDSRFDADGAGLRGFAPFAFSVVERGMLGRALRAVLVVGVVLLLAGGWFCFALQPPEFEVPPEGTVFAGVTVIDPGKTR